MDQLNQNAGWGSQLAATGAQINRSIATVERDLRAQALGFALSLRPATADHLVAEAGQILSFLKGGDA